jgi:pteridine reductase
MRVTEPAKESSSMAGKVVMITGGRRVGGELAQMLGRRGANVAMTYHKSRESIERTIALIENEGGQGMAVEADLSKAADAERAVAQVVEKFGSLYALVNMASVYKRTPFSKLVPADFDEMIAMNLAAPYHTAVAAAKVMLEQAGDDGIKGKIVNVGDWATERPYKDYLPYLVAKGGLTTMTLALAKELAPHIPVTMVQPAMIVPPPDFSEEDKNAVLDLTPLRRFGSPDDVNRLILYMLEGTNFITGVCYRVDGGRFLGTDE